MDDKPERPKPATDRNRQDEGFPRGMEDDADDNEWGCLILGILNCVIPRRTIPSRLGVCDNHQLNAVLLAIVLILWKVSTFSCYSFYGLSV